MLLAAEAVIADGLRVEDPSELAFAVAELSNDAEQLGFSRELLVAALKSRLSRVGLEARPSNAQDSDAILFIDVIVDGNVYYVALDFWRVGSFAQPDGQQASAYVSVWQDFSIGSHDGDRSPVDKTFSEVVERFIVQYVEANDGELLARAAANH